MNLQTVENEISQAVELLESAYANVSTHKNIATERNINTQTAIKNLNKIAILCRSLKREIREYQTERHV